MLLKSRWGTEASRAVAQHRADTRQARLMSDMGKMKSGVQMARYLSREKERMVITEA